ncbi:MAG: CehA/McbA family metallohydrolase [Ignavibacteria bacterium]
MFEYAGAIHIHSTYSDGTGSIEDIVKAAADSGLDFIIMTDHNTLKPKEDGYEKWMNNVMVIIGYEVNDMENKNHYLVLGLDKVVGPFEVLDNGELGCKMDAKEYVRKIKDEGGFGFIAHPDEERHVMHGHRAYPWTHWDTDDFTGIEIWNHMSEWIEGMNDDNKLQRFLHPLKSIISPQQKTLAKWDVIAQKRPIGAIGSVDAHAFKQNLLGFFEVEIFAYKVLFKSIRTHVLVKSELNKNDKKKFDFHKSEILDSLKHGRCFISNFYHGDAQGFRFFAEVNNQVANMGDTITLDIKKNILLKTFVPGECTIKLIHNGGKLHEITGMRADWSVDKPGVYRVECWVNNTGWIFSNHIRVNINT